jgi:hypothetical protein
VVQLPSKYRLLMSLHIRFQRIPATAYRPTTSATRHSTHPTGLGNDGIKTRASSAPSRKGGVPNGRIDNTWTNDGRAQRKMAHAAVPNGTGTAWLSTPAARYLFTGTIVSGFLRHAAHKGH